MASNNGGHVRGKDGFGYHGRGGRGFARGRGGCGDQGEERPFVRRIRCYYCKSYGHIEAMCWNTEFDEQEQGKINLKSKVIEQNNFVQNVEGEEGRLFEIVCVMMLFGFLMGVRLIGEVLLCGHLEVCVVLSFMIYPAKISEVWLRVCGCLSFAV